MIAIEVVKEIREAITSFRENAVEIKDAADTIDFNDIISTLSSVVRTLPQTVMSLRGVGRHLLRVTAQFEDMPPVVAKINDIVSYITDLFNDIKTDIMNMYNVSKVVHFRYAHTRIPGRTHTHGYVQSYIQTLLCTLAHIPVCTYKS